MTSSGKYMQRTWLAVLAGSALAVSPALARSQDRPITEREPDAVDVAKTPMTDLNLSRTEIPALLVEAETRPYSLQNLERCPQIIAAVEELNAVLGPDIDLPQAERARFSKGRIAQWAVGTFIPFRSLIREVSGANRQEREIRAAIQAGLARRGFLKGVGAARGCAYPGSPATESIVAQHIAALQAEEEKAKGPASSKSARIEADPKVTSEAPAKSPPSPARADSEVIFKSEAVVQPTRPRT
jgi:hypothetical protein